VHGVWDRLSAVALLRKASSFVDAGVLIHTFDKQEMKASPWLPWAGPTFGAPASAIDKAVGRLHHFTGNAFYSTTGSKNNSWNAAFRHQ